jgi:hypothetical protein
MNNKPNGKYRFMPPVNHPNRQGHNLVVAELLRWFPVPPVKQ